MYCCKNFKNGISKYIKNNIVIIKIEILPNKNEIIFEQLQLKTKYINAEIIITKFMYTEGTCMLKKAKTIVVGNKNQKKLDLPLIEMNSNIKEITERINEC